MLFNSYGFIFVLLPVALAGFFLLGRRWPDAAVAWLALVSLAFYAVSGVRFMPLLLGSIVANYLIGCWLARGTPRYVLPAAVTANLLALGWFKYAGFLAATAGLTGLPAIALPIGISFFSFTQIAFLVDAARGDASEPRFVHYVLFVTYFPHLIAGPVLHHQEMIPQFRRRATFSPSAEAFAVGMTVFALGLFKKVVLADSVAPYADIAFLPSRAPGLGFTEAWGGTLAYTLQIYFDFSAYSDMAIGLSRMFNIRLPVNFDSPYRATCMIDFWRRWHMTLSRFLRDYLYIPLGGNRLGAQRRHLNLMATMVLGGLWHGAGWGFIIWGALHGFYLVVNHAWRHAGWRLPPLAGSAVTFLAVMLAWVFFRAADLPTALAMLSALLGGHGIAAPAGFNSREVALVAVMLGIALLSPNIREIMARDDLALAAGALIARPPGWLRWKPGMAWAGASVVMLAVALLQMTQVSQFLYFRF